MARRLLISTLLSAALLGAAGCSSARVWVTTDASPPVSATHAIHNPAGHAVGPKGYEVVKHLKKKYVLWSIGYSMIKLNSKYIDVFDQLCGGRKECPERDDESGTKGLVNVETKIGMNWFNYVTLWTGTWVPFVPTAYSITLKGDLVEFR